MQPLPNSVGHLLTIVWSKHSLFLKFVGIVQFVLCRPGLLFVVKVDDN